MSNLHWRNLYEVHHQRWDDFVREHIPEARLVKDGFHNRVYRNADRAYKVYLNSNDDDRGTHQALQSEFEIYQMCEGNLWSINPKYSHKKGEWEVMAMNWLSGPTMNVLIENQEANKISFLSLVKCLFVLGWNGVRYKQFRGRHIYLSENRQPIFIDFGGSVRTSPIVALIKNMSPVAKTNNGWGLSSFGYIGAVMFREKFRKKSQSKNINYINMRPHESFSENVIKQQHEKNKNEAWKALKLGRVAQSKDFKEWKKSIYQWIDKNPEFGCDLLRWEYEEGAIVWGGESWGVIWDQIRSHIDFKDKTVIEVGCGMGLAAVHARLAGASYIHSFWIDSADKDVGQKAVNFFDVDCVEISSIQNRAKASTTEDDVIGLALSIYTNENHWSQVCESLKNCSIIAKRSRKGIDFITQ